jgi:glucosylceramidase
MVCLVALSVLAGCSKKNEQPKPVETLPVEATFWMTSGDGKTLLNREPDVKSSTIQNPHAVIEVDTAQLFQVMDGFGYTLTGGSALLLSKMGSAERSALLRELFSAEGIGVSYLRLSIGASDLSDRVFSYNDLPAGMTDPEMKQFSLDPERRELIPVLKEILAINPTLKLLGSPWSPPVWMKDNKKSIGGSLLPQYYEAYALYLVKYIQGMAAEGITIDAITVQNEPLHPGNNPSLLMPAAQQAAFIGQSLGPAFRKAGLNTKIIIYDHNADRIDYPLEVLADAGARQYIDGTAFHLYGGSVNDISRVHEAYPDKNLYFTEQWVGAPSNFGGDLAWHVRELIVGASRNWCKTVLEWNLAADPNQDPHTEGGCTQCLGAVTIDGNKVTRNVAYYIIGHASKFVKPGAVRMGSTLPEGFPNVVFRNPDGSRVAIVLNDASSPRTFNLRYAGRKWVISLPAGGVGTLVW